MPQWLQFSYNVLVLRRPRRKLEKKGELRLDYQKKNTLLSMKGINTHCALIWSLKNEFFFFLCFDELFFSAPKRERGVT
jgi:hypothetical protein